MIKRFCMILVVAFCLSACKDGVDSGNREEVSLPAAISGQESNADIQDMEEVSGERSPESETSENAESSKEDAVLKITVGEHELLATFEKNSSAEEFQELLSKGPVTIQMEDYGGFEKVGPLGTELTRNDKQITTQPGDIILYQGNQITIYYGVNSWNFTRLAKINDTENLKEKLGDGSVQVTFSLE